MGYSRSANAVRRVLPFLDLMLKSEKTIEWASNDPYRVAGWIHEGIFASQFHDEFKKYATLNQKFAIKKLNDRIIADFRVAKMEVIREALSTMRIEDAEEALEIIGAAIKYKANTMHFPYGEPSVQLKSWCDSNGYFIVENDEGITLTKDNVGELAWTPIGNQ